MTNTTATDTTIDLLAEARGWLEDCFEDLPAGLTDDEVVAGVRRHYCGGWAAFAADAS